ncbi:MAG: LCP family protein [Chloroflexi bacterium]|nr:LCP family protein [Chloroflexota bacterium]
MNRNPMPEPINPRGARNPRLVGIVIVVLAIGFGAFIFNVVRNLVSGWSTGSPNPFGFNGQETELGADNPIFDIELIETPIAWDGTARVTILFMGLDFKDWKLDQGPPRTDTMVLFTIDPITKSAGMLSIPRDLWVEIPGYEYNRINTAYFLGETYKVPGGGPALAMRTIENLLGVPIQYYVILEFSAFERMIDEIGGIDVLVKQRVKISPIGRLSLWLEEKPYHLDGPETLAYARARNTEGSDFDRAERQQQVALAIRDRLVGFEIIPVLIAKAPVLYQEFRSGIRTNLIDVNAPPGQLLDQIQQLISLGLLAMDIDPTTIKKGVIGPPDMVTFSILPSGADVLKPVPDQIRILRDEIFASTSALGPSIDLGDPLEAARLEGATLGIYNGAGIEGLAGRTAQFFEDNGLSVLDVGNAQRSDYLRTLVIDYTGNPYMRQFLMELGNISESQILSQIDPESEVDIALILGADWFMVNSQSTQ